MDRSDARALLSAYSPEDRAERARRDEMLALLERPGELFSKLWWEPGHFTASAFVLDPAGEALLLVHHAAFGFWMQPGGHLDPDDASLLAAARRELAEEAGVRAVEPLLAGVLDLDIHEVPAKLKKDQPAHRHYDVRFAFRARDRALRAATDARDARWVPLDVVETIDTDASVRKGLACLRRRLG